MIFKISLSSSGFLLRLKRVFSSFQGPRDFWWPRWPLQFETQHGTTKSSKSIHITFDNARRAHLRAAWTGAIRSEFNLSTSIKFLWWHVKQRNRFNKPMSVSQNYGPLKITRNGQLGRKPMKLCWAPHFEIHPNQKFGFTSKLHVLSISHCLGSLGWSRFCRRFPWLRWKWLWTSE